jgi:hypothetical protein
VNRMDRGEFFAKLAGFDDAQLRKALWNLYWRGSAPLRERIEAEIDPVVAEARKQQSIEPIDPDDMLDQVQEFVALAHSGAYLGGDRRVTPRERTRWRFTFQRLAADAQAVLCGEDLEVGASAMELLIDLACETSGLDYFRSEDPLEAARFVVSEAVALLWTRVRDSSGFQALIRLAMRQLVRWESPSGWTRSGLGRVAAKESSLTEILAGMLSHSPDVWVVVFDSYLEALDHAVRDDNARPRHAWPSTETVRDRRTSALTEWHLRLLIGTDKADGEPRFERLTKHGAFGGPALTLLGARVAQHYGETDRARSLVLKALKERPYDTTAQMLAKMMGVPLP